MTCPDAAETTARSVPTLPSGTRTTPGWRSPVMRANVSSAARAAAGGIGATVDIFVAHAISPYSDHDGKRGH